MTYIALRTFRRGSTLFKRGAPINDLPAIVIRDLKTRCLTREPPGVEGEAVEKTPAPKAARAAAKRRNAEPQ